MTSILSDIPRPLSALSVVERRGYTYGRGLRSATCSPSRGVAIGGWMNMENFINGYPGRRAQSSCRRWRKRWARREHRFFFDRLLDHYLAEDDIAFIAGLGANAVRLPSTTGTSRTISSPLSIRKRGFARLDRASAVVRRPRRLRHHRHARGSRAGRIPTGTPTTGTSTLCSGRNDSFRIGLSLSGRSLHVDIGAIRPSPATTC